MADMEIQQTRRERLRQLITERYDGSQSKLIDETGENQGEISALLRTKSFGEKKARKLEQKIGLPRGWLDDPAMGPAAPHIKEQHPLTVEEERASYGAPAPVPGAPVPTQTKSQEEVSLVWVAQDELALLSQYRQASEVGRSSIRIAADVAEKDMSKLLLRNQS